MTNNWQQFNLSPSISEALEKLSYTAPTEVQEQVIPALKAGHDLMAKAQTGSGKTAAYAIPICDEVIWEENKPQALIITPTRELADQVRLDALAIGRFKRLKAAALYGRQSFAKQKLELKQKTHIISGTPGRLLDHLEKGTFDPSKLKYVIIDEADELFNRGFIEQVEAIMAFMPKDRLTGLFSATFSEEVESLAAKWLKTPERFEIASQHKVEDLIQHFYMKTEEKQKFELLKQVTMSENPDTCMIFCRTQDRTDELTERLDRAGYSCDKIHGGMVQEERFDVMNEFKRGDFRYLIATDIAARGIDVANVSLVVNYDLPLELPAYTHRSGRTGRAGQNGKVVSFVEAGREDDRLAAIIEYTNANLIELYSVPPADIGAFWSKMDEQQERKTAAIEKVSEDILKIYVNGGKKKKLRAGDFVGTITSIDGVTADDIGIITIEPTCSFIEIHNGKGHKVINALKETTIKGKKLKVYPAKK
ncbi:DEAD/DEAH box helicase [Jeotgalibacillus haloalkalitolerans]|uniref:DEAD/DEAH box helicase n=1 Tax=Jeotgalibacillus haloalkalitolerans TaxID=3104292 RepID=A0ABU5KIY5_9BACL|nr:DEAD/DEAH box helicase [Jeotgalibacillus sp. HH7-29]MDZ5710891.1 DEAD/DEAH box helicase [Jeotgalibacillus sp. HH7-29]